MAKKLVGLYVPAIQELYDVMVPMDLSIAELTSMLVKGVVQLSEDRFRPTARETLSLRNPAVLLNPQNTLSDYDIDDGFQLVLV